MKIDEQQIVSLITQNMAACSVEINQTSKGDFSFSVKAYANTSEDALKQALATVKLTRNELSKLKEVE
jgi:hypothetical protein